MLTREEQIRIAEEQLSYALTQMRVWQDQGHFNDAAHYVGQLNGLADTLMYLRSIPNPKGVVEPTKAKARRKLEI